MVFVNFANATDYIQRNAYMVEKVIDSVNTWKAAAGSTEKNAVLGMSMGGLVARYALRDMEINNKIHDTKLYISHDAPHQGANVPLGFQAMVRHLVGEEISLPVFLSLIDINIVDIADVVPDLEDGLNLLQTPAAQQMLIYQLQGTGSNTSINNNTLHSSFANEYANMGLPQQNNIRNIAIANGSECGTPLSYNPQSTLVHLNEKIDLPYFLSNIALAIVNGLSINPSKFITSVLSTDTDLKAQFDVKALPNQQSAQIYKGKIFIEKTILFVIDVEEPIIDQKTLYSYSSMLPLDNNGGGIYDLEEFISLPPEIYDYVYETQFNFIPTYSSLDIGSGNQTVNHTDLTRVYSPLSPPQAPKNSSFDNFYTNPTSSEGHIQFTFNNGNWMMDELRGDEAFYSCASACGQLELSINGSGNICNSGTYNINNLTSSSDVDVQWSILPTTAATLSPTDNSVTLTKSPSYNGNITLSASVGTTCNDLIVQKQMWVGTPFAIPKFNNGEYISHGYPNQVCNSEQIVTDMTVNGETNVSWTLVSSSHFTSWSQQGDNLRFYLWAVNHTATFRFTATNSCGSLTRDYTFNSKDCSGGGNDPCDPIISISQNPVDTDIEIINIPAPCNPPLSKASNQNKQNSKDKSSIAILYDFHGNLIKSQTPANGKMNVQDLKKGHYILSIKNNGDSKIHHIIVK